MWEKVQAYVVRVGVGTALAAAAILGYGIFVANANAVAAMIDDPTEEITGPQASCFASCAVSIWPAITPANVVEIAAWREGGVVTAYAYEQQTEDEDVFAALDLGGGVVPACPITVDGSDVTFCVKWGPTVLTTSQKACIKTCAAAIVSGIKDVKRMRLQVGPPKTITISRDADMTTSEYAACRAAGTCRRGEVEE